MNGQQSLELSMDRQQALEVIWKRLLIILITVVAISLLGIHFAGSMRIPALVFLIGNIGGYVEVHKRLKDLTDGELIGLSTSWLGIIVPSFVGGILGLVLWMLFLSNLIAGDLFPKFVPDPNPRVGFEALFDQHAKEMADYGKLFFWSFVAGFNQSYIVDIINSVRTKA